MLRNHADLHHIQAILGHASITDTERYAHLSPGHWREGARSALQVDLTPGRDAEPARIGQPRGSKAPAVRRKPAKS